MQKEIQEHINVPLKTSSLPEVRNMARDFIESLEIDEHDTHFSILAVDEAVTSCIGYAAENNVAGMCSISLSLKEGMLTALIESDPADYSMPELQYDELVKELKKIRYDLSIFMLQKIVDELEFTYKRGKISRLRIRKKLVD